MQVIEALEARPAVPQGSVVTTGVYDGVHRGHQVVLARLREIAKQRDVASALVTFDRHPLEIIAPNAAPKLLTTLDHKLDLLRRTGIDYVLVLTFDEDRRLQAPQDFCREIIVEALHARVVVEGADHHFGRDRAGNIPLLRACGATYGFDVIDMALVTGIGATPVSSTMIRVALRRGDVEAAAQALGRYHEVRGVVVHGDQRGRSIGFATANLDLPANLCIPGDGVYAGWFRWQGRRLPAVINVGKRPTFYGTADRSLVEAHLLDWDGNLYGVNAAVEFVSRLREERRFPSIDDLVTQIAADAAEAKHLMLSDPAQWSVPFAR